MHKNIINKMYRFLIFIFFLLKLTVIHSQETLEVSPKDLVVLFSKYSDLTKLTVDLNGNWKIASESNNKLKKEKPNVCLLYYTEDYVDFSNEAWIKIFNYQISNILNSVQSDQSPEINLVECGQDEGDGLLTIYSSDADILIFQFSALNFINYQDSFDAVYIMEESDVIDSIDIIIAQENLEKEKIAKIEERYRELAFINDKSHIGSINIKYPDQYQDINLCTFVIEGDSAIPFILYPTFDLESTYTPGLIKASEESLKNLNKNEPYNEAFNDLEEFFELWQLNNQDCDTFIAYPNDLIKFVDSASKINDNFVYEFNYLIETKKLYTHWAKLDGDYLSWENYKFAEQINGNKEILSKLKKYNISNFDEYLSINEEMIFKGYLPDLNDGSFYQYNFIIEYLDDLNVANLEGTSANEIKKQRLEKERIEKELEEQRRIEEEKLAEQERKERLAKLAQERQMKIDSGNGEFTFYGENEKCTEDETEVCVDREQFLQICEKVEGYYNIGYGTIFGGAALLDYVLRGLEENMGENAYSEAETYVSKGGDCIFTFRASGTYQGNYIDRTYYCKVWSIIGDDGWFGTSSLDSLSCQYN